MIENVETEMDLFYAEGDTVHKRGLVEANETDHALTGQEVAGFWVCQCSDFIPGAPEQIARALNRLPKLEVLLVEIAGVLRSGEADALNKMAAKIEEEIVNG